MFIKAGQRAVQPGILTLHMRGPVSIRMCHWISQDAAEVPDWDDASGVVGIHSAFPSTCREHLSRPSRPRRQFEHRRIISGTRHADESATRRIKPATHAIRQVLGYSCRPSLRLSTEDTADPTLLGPLPSLTLHHDQKGYTLNDAETYLCAYEYYNIQTKIGSTQCDA